MAIDAYMTFTPYTGSPLSCESSVDFSKNTDDQLLKATPTFGEAGKVFEVEEWSQLSIEQTLNIGSQSSGIGAGKVDFKEFSITRRIDIASPVFFRMACSGTPFKNVTLGLRRSSGGETSGKFFLRFDFKLVGVKTISYSHDETAPKEEITLEYGGFLLRYAPQNSDGSQGTLQQDGWDKTKNIRAQNDFDIGYNITAANK